MFIEKNEIKKLIEKYGGSVPRYTSYPTAPEWKQTYSLEILEESIKKSNLIGNDYSLYLHIPFCESQCYYCACNVVISPKHGIEERYIERLKEELEFLSERIDHKRKIVQMAWGGGTPTYLSSYQIQDLYDFISDKFSLYDTYNTHDLNYEHEYAIEIDPRVTNTDQLKTIYRLGFNRLSMGIQDFNPQTQSTIHRLQSVELVENLLDSAREIGFKSINFDLIYGLPFQTLDSFASTIKQVIDLDPDRIALFNYAHIPQFFPFQKKYIPQESLPSQDLKLEIFDLAVKSFTNHGYIFIGLDHFAKANDDLYKAYKKNTLYRNFQGYTTHDGCDLFGVGITAISDIAGLYKQNHKKLNDYYSNFSSEKFMLSSIDDLERRSIIKSIMCQNNVLFDTNKYNKEFFRLKELEADSLLTLNLSYSDCFLQVTELGRFFVRNIASCFDNYLNKANSHKIFSKSL
jgi:oxygen-independent coproporphyrinogen III oxidase